MYVAQGDYEVRISGTFPRIFFNLRSGATKIISIDQWGTQQWTSMDRAFYGATNLAGQATDEPDLSAVTTMSLMFSGANAFNQDIGDWDVSNVTNMFGMFSNATVFNQDISAWNVSNATNMESMFSSASAFNQNLGGWDVSKVTTMRNMLSGVPLSTANYDALLQGWSARTNLQQNVPFGVQVSSYCAATTGRNSLEGSPNNWMITDNGQADGCADAGLSGLSLSIGMLNETVAPATTAYTTSVRGTVAGIAITATATSSSATIAIAGISADNTALTVAGSTVSGLTEGDNIITITVTAADGIATGDYTLTVTRSMPPSTDHFITTWRVTAGDLGITIPTTGTGYDYTVDWGDGTPTTDHADSDAFTDASHTYVTPGEYVVVISGAFPRIYFNFSGDRQKIIAINQWGTQQWASMAGAFHGAENMLGQAFDTPDLSAVTEMGFMFSGAGMFDGDASGWNVSSVTNMSGAFVGASAFNGDVSGWDVSKVTDMSSLFSGATVFNQDVGGWNVGMVTNMESVFQDATAFNQDIGGWDVSEVTSMLLMFDDAAAFDQNLGAWDVSSVADMRNVFSGVTLSTANYDALLRGWSRIDADESALQSGIAFHAGNSTFCDAVAKAILTATGGNNWTITDGDVATGCSADANLGSLTLSTGALNETFAAATTAYTTSVGTSVTGSTITATTANTDATIAIAGTAADNSALTVSGETVTGFTEGENTITLTVTGQTGGTRDYTITVAVNLTPSAITLANSTIAENNAINAVIGGLSATDGNASDTHTYSLAAGTGDTDNASFSISGSNLVAAVVFDYEAKSAYSVRIATDDSNGGTFEKAFALTVNDVTNISQTITFGTLAARIFRDAPFDLAATASSGLEVSYSSSDGSVASVAGSTVTIVGAGTTVITASQAGDDDYAAATVVAQDLVVNQADQTITLTPVTDKVTTDAPFDVAVSSTSGLLVMLTVSGPATISATTLTLAGTEGTVTITADQAGNDNYNAAPSVVQSFDVVDMRMVTGLEEEAPANKIILHPIPANNTIYIDMGDQKLLEMTVTDLNGKQMTVHAQDSQLDISSLKEGYYILRITTDQGVFSQKIIKQ